MTLHHHTLPNGLTIIAEPSEPAHTAAVGFFVNAGSRDEDKAVMGVSHFLEHMMFKGTARRTADDVNREFDEIGANYNAYTSQENTVYYAQVLPEFLPRAIDLIGDMLRPALRESDFDMEKNVILEEIGMYDDRPSWRLQDTIIEKHFGEHPLSYRVLGTKESVGALRVEQMRAYFEHRYSPDNITVAAAGRLEFDALVKEVDRLAGAWKPTGAKRDYKKPSVHAGSEFITDAKANRHYIAMMCAAPSAQDPRRYAAQVLSDVLGDSEGSRLFWSLVDPGLADEADFSFFPHDGAGSYFTFASCDPERAEQVEKTLLGELDRFGMSIEADEIDRAKNKIATAATLSGENPGGRMRHLGGQWLYLREYTPLSEEIERLMAVSVKDVKQLVEEFPFSPRTIVRLGPSVVK